MLALLLILLAQDPSENLSDRAIKLAQDPDANREAILKLGPAAIRPLIEVRTPELEPVLRDLKFQGSKELRAKLVDHRFTLRVKGMKVDHLIRFIGDTAEAPVFVDPGLVASVKNKTVALDLNNAPLEEYLQTAAEQGGLEYGIVRGCVIVSTPDRLWTWPDERPRVLDDAAAAALKAEIAKLKDASPAAERAIAITGISAVPYLEEAAKSIEGAHRDRVRAMAARLRARSAAPLFRPTLSIETQELGDLGKTILGALRAKKASIDVGDFPLSQAMKLVLPQADVVGETSLAGDKVRVSCDLKNLPAIDVVYFLASSVGFDICYKDGKVWIDTREAIEKLLKGR